MITSVIVGGQSAPDRAGELVEAIKDLVYDQADGLSLALVIGCLEIAKSELLAEAE